MVVISRSQFEKNTGKYLTLAETKRVIIKSGGTELELGKKKRLITDEDLATGLTGEQLLGKVLPRIDAMYSKK